MKNSLHRKFEILPGSHRPSLRISPRRCYPKRDHTAGALNLLMSNRESSNPSTSEPDTSTPGAPESTPAAEPTESSPAESFKDIFSEYEQSHSRKSEAGNQRREGTVIAVTADSVVLDIGFKKEGVLLLTAF